MRIRFSFYMAGDRKRKLNINMLITAIMRCKAEQI